MKKKKALISTVMGLSILCFGTGASAETDVMNEVDGVSETDVLVNTGTSQSVQAALYEPLDGTVAKKVTNTSKTKSYKPLSVDDYAVASSSSSAKEDYIYAKCRTYNGTDGALIKSKTAEGKKTTYVSAKAVNTTAYTGNDWAVGNHTYKLAGYKTINHETKATW